MSRESSSHSSKDEGFQTNADFKRPEDVESSDMESDDLGSIADRRASQDSTEDAARRDMISGVSYI